MATLHVHCYVVCFRNTLLFRLQWLGFVVWRRLLAPCYSDNTRVIWWTSRKVYLERNLDVLSYLEHVPYFPPTTTRIVRSRAENKLPHIVYNQTIYFIILAMLLIMEWEISPWSIPLTPDTDAASSSEVLDLNNALRNCMYTVCHWVHTRGWHCQVTMDHVWH